MAKDIREFYRDQLYRATERVDTRIVLQMHRIISMTLDEIFVSLTARRTEKVERWRERGWREEEPERDDDRPYFERPETIEQSNVSIDEILTRSQYNVILGDPGTGKTTLLKWLAHRWAAAARRSGRLFEEGKSEMPKELAECVPVPLELRYFAQELDEGKTSALEDYLGRGPWDWVEEGADRAGQFVLEQAQAGRCLLLLDGLDEAISKELRVRVVDAIDDFLRDRPGCRCVVSSRIVGYELAPLPQEFDVSTLEPFTPKQTSQFFHNWALAIERAEDIQDDDFTRRRASKRAEEILDGLGYDPTQLDDERREAADPTKRRLQELAQNPMLCTLIGLIHHQGKRMPEDRVELYRLCVEAFVYDWEVQKRVRQVDKEALDKFETMDVLEELALRLHEDTSDNRASSNEIRDLVFRFLTEEKGQDERPARVRTQHQIELIQGRVGLLIERGEAEYGFAHLQLQEYLTGRAITRRRQDIPLYLGRHLWESRWQEPILLAAAHLGQQREQDATEYVDAVRATPPPAKWKDLPDLEKLLHHALFVAVRCVGEAKRVHFRTRRRAVEEIHVLFRDRVRIHLWEHAARALSFLRDEPIPPALLAALQGDARRSVRGSACNALASIGSEQAVGPLIDVLREDCSDDVRRCACNALASIGSDQAVGPLMDVLRNDDSEDVRRCVCSALASIGSGQAVGPLMDLLRNGDSEDVRGCAAGVLGSIGSEQAVLPLIDALRADESEDVRRCAADALASISPEQAVLPLIGLLRNDDNPSVRAQAAYALSAMPSAQARQALLDVLRNDHSPIVRAQAARAMRTVPFARASRPLLDALRGDDSRSVRVQAIHALSTLSCAQTVELLLDILRNDDSPSVRAQAAHALSTMPAAQVLQPLLDALRDDDSHVVRAQAASALSTMPAAQVLQPLLDALRDDDNHAVRAQTASVLGRMRSEQAAGELLNALRNDGNHEVRTQAASALGRMRSEQAVQPLLLALRNDESHVVRACAASTLGGMRSGQAAQPLLDALRNDDSKLVRKMAASALTSTLSSHAVRVLTHMLQDRTYWNTWTLAERALREIILG